MAPPPHLHGLGLFPQVISLSSEILFHGERHRLGRISQQTRAQSCGDNTAKKIPQRRAAVD
jgi:hypothetical protein